MVGHGFVHLDADDAAHHIVEAFQVLHVQRGPDVDAGGQQLFHILPALGVARAGHIAVRQLVQQQHIGVLLQCAIQVKLRQLPPLVGQGLARQLAQAVQLLLGLGPAMGFDQAHQHRAAGLALALGGSQHGIGLAHASIGAKVDAQLAACGLHLFGLQLGDQRIRIGARGHRVGAGVRTGVHGHRSGIVCGLRLIPTQRPSAAHQ